MNVFDFEFSAVRNTYLAFKFMLNRKYVSLSVFLSVDLYRRFFTVSLRKYLRRIPNHESSILFLLAKLSHLLLC